MQLDARTMSDGTRLDAAVCIIGAGPAGITVARAFSGSHRDVLVLESGGPDSDDRIQELNEGTTTGVPYAGLRSTRHRAIGGASRIWNTPVRGEPGAKYAPLDRCDFAPGADGNGGWPFDRSLLEPHYARAQADCGLGPFAWDAADWPGKAPLPLAHGAVISRVYQFGTARQCVARKLGDLQSADNIRICHHATALALELDGSGRRVTSALVASAGGARLRVHAPLFVLAAGAIENARLLLVTAEANRVPWNEDLVGRGFMEHARDHALTLLSASADLFGEAAFYDAHEVDGVTIGGRLALADDAVRALALPNASVTLLPRVRMTRSAPFGGRQILAALRRLGRQRGPEGYGWSRSADPAARFDAFRLILNAEQRPHPENRIVLDRARDVNGVPRAMLHLHWRAEEQAGIERLRRGFADAIEHAGLGRVEIQAGVVPDLNAHHHAGTTRMHADPRHGVVDGDGRVHGTDNLYVTGASVFPSAGFANPTLTIVAMAIRLADLLRDER